MSPAAERYGQALYDLARDEGLSGPMLEELESLCEIFAQESGYLRLLDSPALPKQERRAIVDRALRGRVEPYVLNFIKLLSEKGYARQFPDCVKVFRERYYADNGIVSVTAVTAVALTDEQCRRLTEKLEQITGKTVKLQCRVDPKTLGGVRLDYDGKRVEDTVAGRLDAIRSMLRSTVL